MQTIKLLVPKHPPIEAALPYLKRIDEARWYSNFGINVRELEDRLSEKFGGAYVVTTSNCTTGLMLAYLCAGLHGLRSIDLPALTFPATWFAAMQAGLNINVVDVDHDTWITGTVAGFGTPAYARIVDAAGAIYEQKAPIIKDGFLAAFSMHATKPISAGEGGFVVTWDQGEADMIRQMSNFGFRPGTGLSTTVGTNGKMSEYTAAIGLAGLDAWDREPWLQLWDWYDRNLPACVVRQVRPRGAYPMMVVKLPVPAVDVITSMLVYGIECRQWYCPTMNHHPVFPRARQQSAKQNGARRSSEDPFKAALPVTTDLAEHLIGLPYHLHLTESDVAQVCERLGHVVEFMLAIREERPKHEQCH